MRAGRITAVLGAAAVLVAPAASAAAATNTVGAGLWPADYRPAPSDCGVFTRDANDFCVADDPGSVELGVKFTASRAVRAAGVRLYRVDPAATGVSLWSADGTLLATGTASSSTTHAWQDVALSQPVTLVPGATYIASYHSPEAVYGFEYEYFTNSALTVGPFTAVQSIEGDRNGVYCYVGQSCGLFPSNSYRDLNYWVTPLWSYRFSGFFQPVSHLPTWNKAKAGRAIPVKFSLGGDQGLDILKPGYPKVSTTSCPGSTNTIDDIEETVTAGASTLTYDAVADQYVYTWKTDKAWSGRCVQFELGLRDDTSHTFAVQFVK